MLRCRHQSWKTCDNSICTSVRMELFDSTSVEFCLHQTSQRGIETNDMASFGLIVVRESAKVVQYAAASSMRSSPYVRCDAQLQRGALCVPVCFNATHSGADVMITPRREETETRCSSATSSSMISSLVLAVHSAKPLIVSEVRVTPEMLLSQLSAE